MLGVFISERHTKQEHREKSKCQIPTVKHYIFDSTIGKILYNMNFDTEFFIVFVFLKPFSASLLTVNIRHDINCWVSCPKFYCVYPQHISNVFFLNLFNPCYDNLLNDLTVHQNLFVLDKPQEVTCQKQEAERAGKPTD